MATVEEVVKNVQSLVPTNFKAMAVAKWVDDRYKEMVSRIRFKHLRKTGELSLPAVISAGTVTIARGSTSVVGVDTTFQTDVGSGVQEHYYFRARNAWYKIASIGGELSLTLASAFAEDDVSAGAYTIVKRTHPLASDARWLGRFVLARLRRPLLGPITREEFDISYPGRWHAGLIPDAVCEDGVDSNGYTQVEIYPPPKESELIAYVYWALPTALTLGSTIPQVIDDYVLKEGVLIDVYRYLKLDALDKGNIEAAAVYSNDERKQITSWERQIKDAIRTQRGADDLSFILVGYGGKRLTRDITTAHDHVYASWDHP